MNDVRIPSASRGFFLLQHGLALQILSLCVYTFCEFACVCAESLVMRLRLNELI